ncbi:hypothetical protein KI387_012886, partial [Taxus chinensis]
PAYSVGDGQERLGSIYMVRGGPSESQQSQEDVKLRHTSRVNDHCGQKSNSLKRT